ncbi:Hypothetical predicted protein, partial [Podarcis lilfordi]
SSRPLARRSPLADDGAPRLAHSTSQAPTQRLMMVIPRDDPEAAESRSLAREEERRSLRTWSLGSRSHEEGDVPAREGRASLLLLLPNGGECRVSPNGQDILLGDPRAARGRNAAAATRRSSLALGRCVGASERTSARETLPSPPSSAAGKRTMTRERERERSAGWKVRCVQTEAACARLAEARTTLSDAEAACSPPPPPFTQEAAPGGGGESERTADTPCPLIGPPFVSVSGARWRWELEVRGKSREMGEEDWSSWLGSGAESLKGWRESGFSTK